MLNPRLLTCAGFVHPGGVVCDVGTDHALLPVYLVEQGISRRAVAADIGEGPLQSARRTISQHRLEDRIRTVLSDGLAKVPQQEITDVVIAGMGGETILHILQSCPWSLADMNLVLQPMTKADVLRKWLFQAGFDIVQETCAREERFLYAVMQVRFTGMIQDPDPVTVHIGRMDLSDPGCRAYAERQLDMLQRARDGRAASGQDPEPFAGAADALKLRLEA